jgi:UDP-N-acetylmuramoyl-tripeptide--D-alanyl-D-alanine ligase
MINMTLAELARILNQTTTHPSITFNGLSKDTRANTQGTLFIAIQGENFDGHQFVAEAYQKGAVAALVSHDLDCPIPQIIVSDVIAALGQLAGNWRDRFKLPLIGVTGSNGKTTLKNMLAAIVTAAAAEEGADILATEGNLNNNIGVPITLARLNEKQHYGIIEMGMNNPGEITYLTKITKPHVAVITNAAEAHLQGLQDVAGVAREKGNIFLGLPSNGIAILNKDDNFFEYWRGIISQHRYLTFGLKNQADVTATIVPGLGPTQQLITLHTPSGKIDIQLPLLGRHNVMNALAATAAALAINIDLNIIKTALENMRPAPGRMNPYVLASGVRIIDDTYNANPFSTHAAIQTLATFSGKKILVLADMRELGSNAKELHTLTGERARAAGLDYLFTYGDLSAAATAAFGENARHFTERQLLINALQPYLEEGTTILIKGSRSMQMELIISGLAPEVNSEVH